MQEKRSITERLLGPKMSIRRSVSNSMLAFTAMSIWVLCIYPTTVRPFLYPEEYKRRQIMVEQGLHKEFPPGGLRSWSNPFEERSRQEPQYLQKAREEKEKSS